MKCPDCKGSGEYQGLGAPEPCRGCGGMGEVFVEKKEELGADDIVQDNTWMKHSDPLADYDEDDPALNSRWAAGAAKKLLPKINVGDVIHVYDCGWYEVKIMNFNLNASDQLTHYYGSYPSGIMHFTTRDLNYNLTAKRWEIIRAGTPVW